MVDIRTSRRFPVHLPMKVLGDQEASTGSTANFSSGGVYLLVNEGLDVGSSIEFEVTIPAETIGAAEDAHLRCHGSVLRCDTNQEPGRTGVACVIERYEFVRAAESGGE